MPGAFCVFLDVMGIQQLLTPRDKDADASAKFNQCRSMLDAFHRNLEALVRGSHNLASNKGRLLFVAEFSDSAYLVSDRFHVVANLAIRMIRHSFLSEYPLRGGLGVGSFWHELSGVRADAQEVVWSTSSFMGGAVVAAYQATESRAAPGFRVLVHPAVMRRNTEPYLKPLTADLPADQRSDEATHELRCFSAAEVPKATELLARVEAARPVPQRAKRHYEGTRDSLQRLTNLRNFYPVTEPGIDVSPKASHSKQMYLTRSALVGSRGPRR